MFSSNKEKSKTQVKEQSPRNNHIEQGTKIIGNVITSGSLRHDGEMEGDIISEAKVVLGPTCKLTGNLKAVSAEISGEVNGTVEISDMLTIKPTGVVNGDIIAYKMNIEAGGIFNGTSKMGATVKNLSSNESKPSTPQQANQNRQEQRREKSA